MNRLLGKRYDILGKIGEGGMAIVYKAKDVLLNRYVAIKILKPEYLDDKKFIENFRHESQAAASLTHPNIVNIYDVGLEGKNINYIVMEYVEGETLSSIIERQAPLSDAEAIDIAKQMASALSCAHKNGIIHRDVKPHNILVNEDGVAKITDFGIARAVSGSTLVASDKIMGSVHYFSPEQARGGYVDGKSDLYSLGIVMYEMVTGQVPFDGDNPVSVAMMHINKEMTRPSGINPNISPALENVILKATQKIHTVLKLLQVQVKVEWYGQGSLRLYLPDIRLRPSFLIQGIDPVHPVQGLYHRAIAYRNIYNSCLMGLGMIYHNLGEQNALPLCDVEDKGHPLLLGEPLLDFVLPHAQAYEHCSAYDNHKNDKKYDIASGENLLTVHSQSPS